MTLKRAAHTLKRQLCGMRAYYGRSSSGLDPKGPPRPRRHGCALPESSRGSAIACEAGERKLLRWRHRFRFRQRGSTPQTWVKGGMAAADSCISARERTCGVVSSRFSMNGGDLCQKLR